MSRQTTNISPLCEYGWYDWCYFWDSPLTFPDNKEVLGRYLSEASVIGSSMVARILKRNGEVVACTTICWLRSDEYEMNLTKPFVPSLELLLLQQILKKNHRPC
jgi:hypothetical protein